jgi:L-fuconolactonase
MYIDAHQHFWIYNQSDYAWIDDSMVALRRDFLPSDLQPQLANSGFRGSVAIQARQTLEETEWLLGLAEHAPFILGVVGWADLRSPRLCEDLQSLARHPKLVGIRHIVQSEPDDFLLQPDFLRGIATLQEFDLAYDILIYAKHLAVTIEFVQRFPRQRFVLDHLAKPPIKCGAIEAWARGIHDLAGFPNVYAKLSGLVSEAAWHTWKPEDIKPYLDVAFDSFGPGRLMIGSDWPVCTIAAPYSRTMDLVKDYLAQSRYSPAERDAVLGGNAAKFWRLKI